MNELDALQQWPAHNVAAGVVNGANTSTTGDVHRVFELASVTKPIVAYGVLVAVEEGVFDLDTPLGPAGSTVRHLLAHASGLPFEGRRPIAPPGRRRIYSNEGFAVLGEHVEAVECRWCGAAGRVEALDADADADASSEG